MNVLDTRTKGSKFARDAIFDAWRISGELISTENGCRYLRERIFPQQARDLPSDKCLKRTITVLNSLLQHSWFTYDFDSFPSQLPTMGDEIRILRIFPFKNRQSLRLTDSLPLE